MSLSAGCCASNGYLRPSRRVPQDEASRRAGCGKSARRFDVYLLTILSDGLVTLLVAALGAAPWDKEVSNGKPSESLPIVFFRSRARARRLSWRCARSVRGQILCVFCNGPGFFRIGHSAGRVFCCHVTQ